MCAYVRGCVHACVCASTYVCMHVSIYLYVCVCVSVYVQVRQSKEYAPANVEMVCVCTCVDVCVLLCVCVCVCVRLHMHVCVHNVYVDMQVLGTFTCMQVHMCKQTCMKIHYTLIFIMMVFFISLKNYNIDTER